jgi:hypothetical protein
MNYTATPTRPAAVSAPQLHQSARIAAESWTQLVNQAGRQRMLSQRIVLHALLARRGDASAAGLARDALAMFAFSHQTLSRGHPDQPMPADPRLTEAFHGPAGADGDVRDFVALAERALQPRAPEAAMDQLAAQATPILGVLQRVAQLYESLAQEAARHQRRQTTDLIERIHRVAREARIVTFNARVGAARAGHAGREFAALADILARISEEVEQLATQGGQPNKDS